jgi:hypothetical protein
VVGAVAMGGGVGSAGHRKKRGKCYGCLLEELVGGRFASFMGSV